jgi:hypothetical protein
MKKKKKAIHSGARLRGFFRVNIVDYKNGKEAIVGDSGWVENQVTNDGINQYLINWLIGDTAAAKSVKYISLGTGTVPASNATALAGELAQRTNRETVSTSVVSSRTAQFTAAFASNSFNTTTVTLQNIGLFNTTNTAAGTIFAGNTYATSTWASNQAVNCTYQIRFTSS